MQEVFWDHLAKHFMSAIVNCDAMLALEAFVGNSEEPASVQFALLVSAACRYGRHPAKQDFLLLEPVVGEGGGGVREGLTLRAKRLLYVEPHKMMSRSFAKFLKGCVWANSTLLPRSTV